MNAWPAIFVYHNPAIFLRTVFPGWLGPLFYAVIAPSVFSSQHFWFVIILLCDFFKKNLCMSPILDCKAPEGREFVHNYIQSLEHYRETTKIYKMYTYMNKQMGIWMLELVNFILGYMIRYVICDKDKKFYFFFFDKV